MAIVVCIINIVVIVALYGLITTYLNTVYYDKKQELMKKNETRLNFEIYQEGLRLQVNKEEFVIRQIELYKIREGVSTTDDIEGFKKYLSRYEKTLMVSNTLDDMLIMRLLKRELRKAEPTPEGEEK